nr:hypothetical protein [Tanacetum cinerariifolium]
QFWNTAVVKRSGDVTRLQVLVDKKRIVITDEVVREILRLNDAEGVETPLFENMLAVRDVDEEAEAQVPAQGDDVHKHAAEEVATDVVPPTPTSPSPSSPVIPSSPPHQSPWLKDEGIKLVIDQEKDAEVEGRHADKQAEIYNIDLDHSSKVLSMQEDDTEVVAASTPILTAKPKILKIAAAPAVSTRKRKGVIIRDPEEELHSDTPAETLKVKDKGKGILIEDLKPLKKKDQIEMDARYHGIKKKPQTEYEARKNMISYLKKTKGYKMEFFKGKTYDQILPIFQARFDANIKFLFKSREEMEKEDEEIIKSINETPAQKATKRRKLSEESQEADDLKKRLEIVQDEDDDVFVEATLLAQK